MGITVVIPARAGSRRIPHKNRRQLRGVPIINYTLALARTFADRIIVSTDDSEIVNYAIHAGTEVHHRPPHLAENDVGTQEVVANALIDMLVPLFDLAVCIYPTAGALIDGNLLRQKVDQIGRMPLQWRGYCYTVGKEPLRDAGQYYIGWAVTFMEQCELVSDDTLLVPLNEDQFVDVNTYADWRRLELMFKRRQTHDGDAAIAVGG